MAFVNNFSTSFRWLDRFFGTDTKYREYRARLKAAKASGMTPEEYAKMELKLSEQAEREGVAAEKVAESLSFKSGFTLGGPKVKVQ